MPPPVAGCTAAVQLAAPQVESIRNEIRGANLRPVFAPIPLTRIRSCTDRNGPFFSRSSTILPARTGPILGRKVRSSRSASLIRSLPSSASPGGGRVARPGPGRDDDRRREQLLGG